MMASSYMTRRRYHLVWACRYGLASVLCFGASLVAWPNPRGLVALFVGYGFSWLGTRERKRAMQVLP